MSLNPQLVDNVEPPFETKAVANLMLEWSRAQGREVTALKLQKLLFFCHADYILENGLPLIKDSFEAWSYGPVVPSIYSEFKQFSNNPITKKAEIFSPVLRKRVPIAMRAPPEVLNSIRAIFELYSPVSGGQLSAMSHVKGGPWERARALFEANSNINRQISTDLIVNFHRSRAL